MLSTRQIAGIPSTASKNRTNPSSVCGRSSEIGEPPEPPPRPAQDRPEARQRLRQPPPARHRTQRREVQLRLLPGRGLDPRGHPRRRRPPRSPQSPQILRQRRVAGIEALGLEQPHDRGRLQLPVLGQQLVDAGPPPLVDHRIGDRRTPGRWPARLDPLRHRLRMPAHLDRDLLDRPAATMQLQHVHELLLRHHVPGPPAARDINHPEGWRAAHAPWRKRFQEKPHTPCSP